MNAPATILVVRLSAMGDILHALPVVASLKQSFPQSSLSWVVRSRWMPLLEGNPNVDKLIPFDRNGARELWQSCRRIWKLTPDLAIDFQGLIQSATIGRLSQPGAFWGFDHSIAREPLASFLYSQPVHTAAAHRIERNLELAAAAGASRLTTESWVPPGRSEGKLPEGPFVLAAPFAGWAGKQWPVEHYKTLAKLLVREGVALVANVAPSQATGLSGLFAHNSSVAGLIDATRRAIAVVGVDSGPLHLAAALRKPGVAIYGPTDPAATGPYGGSIRVIRRPGVETTYRRDAEIHPAMRAVSPEEVFSQLLPFLHSQTTMAGRAW